MPIQGVGSDQFIFNPDGDSNPANIGKVNLTTAGAQSAPQIALLSDGRFVFVWNSFENDGGGTVAVRARVYNADGTPQGSDFIVETTTAADQFNPVVAALSDGQFIVSWTSNDTGDGANSCVRARIFDADDPSTADDDFIVNTTTVAFQRSPSVTVLSDGSFVIGWESTDDPDDTDFSSVRARLYDSTGAPVDNDFLLNSTTLGIQETPRVTAFGDGFIATWNSAGEDLISPAKYRARIFDADGNGGNEILINSTPTNFQGAPPSLVVLADGRFVATWMSSDFDGTFGDSQDGSETCIRARIFNADGSPVANDFIVNTTTEDTQSRPIVIALADGRFIIGWDRSDTGDGSQTCVRARIYAIDGSANGDDFILPFVTAGDQFNPSLVALPDGRFAATWDSNSDIRAQFFDPKIFTGTGVADTWKGGNLSDTITGLDGNDVISGLAGADTLTGGLGKDRLAGGIDTDIDVFDFNSKLETPNGTGRDIVSNFVHLVDDLDLSDIDAKSGIGGDQSFRWIGAKDFHHRMGELHFVKINKPGHAHDKTIVEGDINGNGHADFQIELTGIIALSKGDFVL